MTRTRIRLRTIITLTRWEKQISGAADAKTSITVDNFILIGLFPSNYSGSEAGFYKGYGSSDSPITNENYLLYDNTPIGFTPFANGGISTIATLSVQNQMQIKTNYVLDVRALDCGAVGEMSDIYAVFQ